MIVRCLVPMILGAACALSPFPVRAQEESVEKQYLSNVEQITAGFTKAGEGYFSPDGSQIVYQAVPQDYPFYQIYTQSLDGQKPQRVSSGRGRTTCSYFHPEQPRLLFASSHLDPNLDQTEAEERRRLEEEKKSGRKRRYSWDFDPHMDMFETDLEGHVLRQLTRAAGYDAEGAYSSDGKLIAFCSLRDEDPEIYLMNADGSDQRRLTNVAGYDGGPFISPDQKWIVFRSDRERPEYLQIYVMDLQGQQQTQLTDNEGVNWGPYWHPSEPYIIWSGADHSDPTQRPNYDLYMMQYAVTDGRFERVQTWRVTDSPAADVLPVFSPDGSQLMWTSTRTEDGSSQLFLADFTLPH